MTYQSTVLSAEEVQATMRLFEATHLGNNKQLKTLNTMDGQYDGQYVSPSVADAFSGWLSHAEYIKQQQENQFTLYWIDGKRQVIKGATIAAALTASGYGQGAIRALDFYIPGDNDEYMYVNKLWQLRTPLTIG